MKRARRAKMGSNTYGDGREMRWVDGYGNSRGDKQTVRSTNNTNGDGNPNANTDARTGCPQLRECNSLWQL